VELSDRAVGIPVSGFKFDWAQNPPLMFQIYFSSTPDIIKDGTLVYNSTQTVAISNVYDPDKVANITPYVGNTTTVQLDKSVPATKYASLVISGTQGDVQNPGDGATVADWAILREGGGRVVPSSENDGAPWQTKSKRGSGSSFAAVRE